MSVKITSNTGSGQILENSIYDYSYSEDTTPLEPSSSDGGASQVTISAIEDTSGINYNDSRLMINNTIVLNDSTRGSLSVQVKSISTNAGGGASIIGDTLLSRLNVVKTAPAFSGSISGAITIYCGLCGITPIFDADVLSAGITSTSVNYIGWKGNVWEYLKMLCSVANISTTNRDGIEMYFSATTLNFRLAKNNAIDITNTVTDIGYSVNSFEAVKNIQLYNYNTAFYTDKIIYEESAEASTSVYKSSIIDTSWTIDAGGTVTKLFNLNATLTSVKNPVCVSAITPVPYTGTTGQYVIVGVDQLPIKPEQWTGNGGNLTVSLTGNPNEISVTVTAPAKSGLLKADGSGELTMGPYNIGIESVSRAGGDPYPALFIVGSGVFYTKELMTFPTGAADSLTADDLGPIIDNPFIVNDFISANAGLSAAQKACGPSVQMNASLANSYAFGTTPGSIITKENNKYRIRSASYSPDAVSINADTASTFANFTTINTGKTFATFDGFTSNISFNEFTVIPLLASA